MNKLEQYKGIIKYHICPICGNQNKYYKNDDDKSYPFDLSISCRIDYEITNFAHFYQNIINENITYWCLRYEHNKYIYEIANWYRYGTIFSNFFFSETGHNVNWSYATKKDYSNLSKEEVIKLIDKAVLLK